MKSKQHPLLLAFSGLAVLLFAIFAWPDPSPSEDAGGSKIHDADPTGVEASDAAPIQVQDKQAEVDLVEKDPTRSSVAAPRLSIENAQVHLLVQSQDQSPIADAWVRLIVAPEPISADRYGPVSRRLAYKPDLAIAEAKTDAQGNAFLSGLTRYTAYQVLIQAEGWASVEFDLHTTDLLAPVNPGPVQLGPSALMEVEILTADGKPMADSRFSISLRSHPQGYSKKFPPIREEFAYTDASGKARLTQMPVVANLSYSYSGDAFYADGEIERIGDWTNTKGALLIVVPTPKSAKGRVIDLDGNPVPGVQITMQRLSSWHGDTKPTLEELRTNGPSGLWNSHSDLAMYRSKNLTDADGRFEGAIPSKAWVSPPGPEIPDMVSAMILIDDYGQRGNWHLFGEEILIQVPIFHSVTGRILGENGEPIAHSKVRFHDRPGPGEEPPKREDKDYSFRFDSDPAPCAEDGSFQKQLIPGNYWLEVLVPGGQHCFAGPYEVSANQELGIIEIGQGRSVRFTAVAADPKLEVAGLKAQRRPQPRKGKRSRVPRATGDSTPWGHRDSSWNRRSREGHIEENSATFSNEPNGEWRYLVQAPGFVPQVIDLELTEQSGNLETELKLEATGHIEVVVKARDGQPAQNTTLQLAPQTDKPRHPVWDKLERTMGYYRDPEVEAVTDETGTTHFRNVFPGDYQIVALEMEKSKRSWSRSAKERPVLATIQVLSDQTTQVEASMAQMADLRVWVSHNGQLKSGVEVFAIPKPKSNGFDRVLDPDPAGVTGDDGSLLVNSLMPGKTHIIGARVPDGSRLWNIKNPWTTQQVEVGNGVQEVTLELATGGVAATVVTDSSHSRGTIYLLKEKEPPSQQAVQALEAEDDEEWIAAGDIFDKIEPIERMQYGATVASNSLKVGETIEFLHIQPGLYRIYAQLGSEKDQAVVITDVFEVKGERLDLGKLAAVTFYPTKLEVVGLPLPEDAMKRLMITLNLYVIPPGQTRAIAAPMFFQPDKPVKLSLPKGEFQLVLYHNRTEVGRSEVFQILEIETNQFTWEASDVKLLAED